MEVSATKIGIRPVVHEIVVREIGALRDITNLPESTRKRKNVTQVKTKKMTISSSLTVTQTKALAKI